eukprot:1949714-Amphidinium_carterae.1
MHVKHPNSPSSNFCCYTSQFEFSATEDLRFLASRRDTPSPSLKVHKSSHHAPNLHGKVASNGQSFLFRDITCLLSLC